MDTTPQGVIENIDAVVSSEEELIACRSLGERVGEAVGSFAGRLAFVLCQIALVVGWVVVRATTSAGGGDLTTALSLAHLVAVLTCRVMRWNPAHPDTPGSDPDRLVLSEGHAVPIIYAALVLPTLACRLGRQPANGQTASSWRVQ